MKNFSIFLPKGLHDVALNKKETTSVRVSISYRACSSYVIKYVVDINSNFDAKKLFCFRNFRADKRRSFQKSFLLVH